MNLAVFRIRLAQGFLKEDEEDYKLRRWRSCISNSQLSVENALKAIISLYEPVPKTHNPAKVLIELLSRGIVPEQVKTTIQDILQKAANLSPHIHIQTDYGDEAQGLTPWELFSEDDAREALETARKVVEASVKMIQNLGGANEV